jgi:flagellar basal body-associated protein FliL
VVILLVLNLLTVAGTAAYFIMFGTSGAAAKHEEHHEPKHKLGPLLALSPLVANISNGDAEESHYLKLSASVEVKDEASVLLVEAAMVPIRDELLKHLSSLGVADTMGPQKRTDLQKKMVELSNHAIGDELVKRVFFTEFVIQ